ncbi:hypothetical protein niasHT_010373 [Heterodera trifolii]|uniref:BTB domain-containing protein n=1 Tax=Heterodera trifolii TaxID=157864 RepID=A0ABD2MBI7_9BILA
MKEEFASANCPVEVADVEPAAFKVMLNFIYADDLNELNGDNAMAVLYAERDELQISGEISIWNAALRWADEKCRQNGIECSAENRRQMLGPALFKIRFPLILIGEFSKNIVPSNVLSKEVIAICSNPFQIVMGFPTDFS